jgi:hypothetical protein
VEPAGVAASDVRAWELTSATVQGYDSLTALYDPLAVRQRVNGRSIADHGGAADVRI